MKKTYLLFIAFLVFPLFVAGSTQSEQSKNNRNKLWYEQPADEWMKSLPLGNGRIGAMVFGGIETETVALNEVTMWSGEPDVFQERPLGKDMLAEIRQLFFDGKFGEANRIVSEFMAGTPHSFGSHVPTGDLKIDFRYPEGKVTEYKRILDIENAINTVSFKVGNISYTREYFCSNPDDALVIRLPASKAKSLNLDVSLDLLREAVIKSSGGELQFSGKVSFPKQGSGGGKFCRKNRCQHRGWKSEHSRRKNTNKGSYFGSDCH